MDEELIMKTVKAVLNNTVFPCKMSLKLAKALIEKIEEKAAQMNIQVVAAISDAAGRLTAVHCMDGAYIGSYDIAVNKTFTSIAFLMPTKKLAELAKPGGPLYGIQNTNEGKVVIFGGGELLIVNGAIIGAVGVSGGTLEQDISLSEYAVEILKEVL